MIARVVDFSVKNPLVVFAVVAVAAVAGVWSIERMPLDASPDLSDTQVIVYSALAAGSLSHGVCAFLAAIIPARRAASISPIRALRIG